eukprot:TRINITY_DN11744_c0_g1_i1.p1 TRINITY_DN11744_c0_g1~~TRINITY_DN11744_c0_g1_i1.p1  ORF type:complete len:444 (-),score=112.19 TRINITY_DN11744_c0_g1_i1:164-1495(-)
MSDGQDCAEGNNNNNKYTIFSRLYSYPTISYLSDTAKKYYDSAKEYNPMIKSSLETVETRVQSVSTFDPIAPLLERVDGLACKSLDLIETDARWVSSAAHTVVDPLISTYDQTKEIFKKSPNGYAHSSSNATELITTAIHYADAKVSENRLVGPILKSTANVVDKCVDVLLPENEDDKENRYENENVVYAGTVLNRTVGITKKLGERVSKDSLRKVPHNAYTGIKDLTYSTVHYLAPQYINPLVHSVTDIKEHTTERMQAVKDMVNDIANQKWSQAEETKKVVIYKIHQSFDQVFAMMVNIAVLFNNTESTSSSSSNKSKGSPFPLLQEIARLIGESKHSIEQSIAYKVSQSELVSRLLDDTQKVLGKARDMISQYPLKDTVISNRVVNGILTSLEDAIQKVLKQSRSIEYHQHEESNNDSYNNTDNGENHNNDHNESYANNE